jgi:hypothetical protein
VQLGGEAQNRRKRFYQPCAVISPDGTLRAGNALITFPGLAIASFDAASDPMRDDVIQYLCSRILYGVFSTHLSYETLVFFPVNDFEFSQVDWIMEHADVDLSGFP